MIERIKAFLTNRADQAAPDQGVDDLQVAAVALMVEVATMDQTFDDAERSVIIALARRRFSLGPAEAESLLEVAREQVADANQLLPFTRIVKDRFSYEERVDLIEELWRVVYADGSVHDYEASLMRRLAGLIYVSDRDSGAARKRASSALQNGDD